MTTPQEHTLSQVVPVHIMSDARPKPAAREIVSSFNTYVISIGALPVQVLSHSPRRKRAVIVINSTGLIALAKSQSSCQDAQANATGEVTGDVSIIDASRMTAPIVVMGSNELWAALITVGGSVSSVTAIKEFEE
jgi:hypothetical protein